MTNLFKILLSKLQLPSIIVWLRYLNFKNYFKSFFSPPKIYKNSEISSKKIALIALFEKGKLRNDVKRLLISLKNKGFDVVGINTQQLEDSEREIFDLYIERFNFGRDFGSYKLGFLNLFKMKALELEKLVLFNDSVFYTKSNLENFIDELSDKSYDVIGATENFEISHHLGSFCISISGEVFRSKKFRNYWKNFKLSDMRPNNIKFGEMYFSKALFACARNKDKIKVLYSTNRLMSYLEKNPDVVKQFNKYSRKSYYVDWARPSGREIIKSMLFKSASKSLLSTMQLEQADKPLSFEFDIDSDDYEFVDNYEGIKTFLSKVGVSVPTSELLKSIKQTIIYTYRQGSQIHQNTFWNLAMGCPIIKNDSVYRGMMNMDDVLELKEYIGEKDFKEFSEIVLSNAYGGHALKKWRLVAFMHGYI